MTFYLIIVFCIVNIPKYMTADAPFLYKNYVAWVFLETENGQPSPVLKLHNLENKETIVVSKIDTYGLYNNFVHIDKGKLLWTDNKDGQGFYKIYDMKTKETKTISSPFQFPSYPMLNEDKIFTLHFNDLKSWGDQEFGYYDMKDEKYHSFYKQKKRINLFRVHNDNLTVINAEGLIENYTITESNFKMNKINIPPVGPENIRYTNNGELLFTYLNSNDQKNYLVVVK